MPEGAPAPAPGAAPGPDDDHVYGLLTVAGAQVALPLSALREVVPCPPGFSTLPVSAPGLLGAMEVRELVVPVVDLGERLGLEASAGSTAAAGGGPASGERVVVVVADGERLLGILAQEVRGVVRVGADTLMELSAEGGPLLVTRAFHGEEGIVSVLDPARVVSLPGVPTVRDRPRSAASVTGGAGTGARTTWTLLRCGEHLLALDVRFVHTTLPSALPRSSVIDGGLCMGVTGYTDQDVPVVDPLRLLGLGTLDVADTVAVADGGAGAGAGLVLRLEAGYVVLALSALVGLVDVAASDCMALPGFSVPRPDLLAGMAHLPGRAPCLVLDGEALLADAGLRELAAANVVRTGAAPRGPLVAAPPTSPAPARAGAGAGAGAPGTDEVDAAVAVARAPMYLTYRAGAPVATRLEQVAEILPLPAPDALVAATAGSDGPAGPGAVLGLVAHRGTSLPLVHLATLLGSGGPAGSLETAGCMLLVAVAGGHVAFAVDSLHEIEPLAWTDPSTDHGVEPDGSRPSPGRALRDSRLIQVGASEALLPDLDLVSLAAAVTG